MSPRATGSTLGSGRNVAAVSDLVLLFRHPVGFYFLISQTLALVFGLVANVTGRTGFSMAPYQNGAFAIAIFLFFSLFLLRQRRIQVGGASGILVLVGISGFILLGSSIGLVLGNSRLYWAATAVYWLNSLLAALILPICGISSETLKRLRAALIGYGILTVVIGSPLSDATTLALLVLFSTELIAKRKPLQSLMTLSPLLLGLGDLNRASLITLGVLIVVVTVVSRRPVKFLMTIVLIACAAGFLTVANLDSVVPQGTQIHRRLVEVQDLLTGRKSVETVVALQQRLLEIELVKDIRRNSDPLTLFFGSGFGKTIDMRLSVDASVTNSALIGGENVHNVHSLVHAVLLRYGWVGLALLAALAATILKNLLVFTRMPNQRITEFFVLLYPLGRMVEAMPASNNLFTEFVFLGLVFLGSRLMRERRLQAKMY